MTIGDKIHKARVDVWSLSVSDLSDLCDVPEDIIVSAEQRHYPNRVQLMKLCEFLGIDVEWVKQSLVTEAIRRNKYLKEI